MSYIDSYDHEYIGALGYLPIYRPLEVIEGDKWGGYNFSATPDNLILGGGSGEHPGLIVHRLDSVVARFLYDQMTDAEEAGVSEADLDIITDLSYSEGVFEFCGWTIRQYANLAQMAAWEGFSTPLSDGEGVEGWLSRSIGELVYFSLPEMNPEQNRLAELFNDVSINATMRNVVCTPPGYPPCGGRRVVEGEILWGVHRF
ncbi:MAG: hypothetical protein MI742_09425 [Desulfobacterales bacterium]|nr:hypothetical protein [Desulfobacterales bacterium]